MHNNEKKSAIPEDLLKKRRTIKTARCNGPFWKPCPGTGGDYICCNYQILTPLVGCGMYCSYCILQEYHDHQCQVLFENYDDLVQEVQSKLHSHSDIVRLGTGEFADSLWSEKKLGLSQKIASLLDPYPNVIVEFKTKSVTIEPLKNIKNPGKVIVGFSINTPRMITLLERGTAPLHKRLEAARRCEEWGFYVAFHFDPMVWYPQWQEEYTRCVDQIFAAVKNPHRIAWWSLGGFRTMPSLKKTLKQYNMHLPLFSGEIILGADGKYRYFRPIRVAFYEKMREQIENYFPQTTLYLCMESNEIWHECGLKSRIPNGLGYYLDNRAAEMLGYKKENTL